MDTFIGGFFNFTLLTISEKLFIKYDLLVDLLKDLMIYFYSIQFQGIITKLIGNQNKKKIKLFKIKKKINNLKLQ